MSIFLHDGAERNAVIRRALVTRKVVALLLPEFFTFWDHAHALAEGNI
jgi:hypothetical protein